MPANFENVINTTIIRFYRDFTTTHSYYIQYEFFRLLANGKGLFHMECHYNFTTVLDRGPQIQLPLVELQYDVYTTFFYSPMSHTLCQQSDETLFGHFVIALNSSF